LHRNFADAQTQQEGGEMSEHLETLREVILAADVERLKRRILELTYALNLGAPRASDISTLNPILEMRTTEMNDHIKLTRAAAIQTRNAPDFGGVCVRGFCGTSFDRFEVSYFVSDDIPAHMWPHILVDEHARFVRAVLQGWEKKTGGRIDLSKVIGQDRKA
jgi:hypothetical protein